MKLTEKQLKIASEIYTYLKNADDEQFELNDNLDVKTTFQNLKSFLFAKRQKQFCDLLDKSDESGILKQLLQKRDQKNYTLLMIAVSNNLYTSVLHIMNKIHNHKELASVLYYTINLKGKDFRLFLNFKIKNNQLSQQEIQEYNKIKNIDVNAIDIAQLKGNKKIIDLLY